MNATEVMADVNIVALTLPAVINVVADLDLNYEQTENLVQVTYTALIYLTVSMGNCVTMSFQ